jgi:hypothetical protein
MIKFDTSPVCLTSPTKSHKDLESANRLVVLVPMDIDYSAATRRIWELANATGMNIHLLGLCKDALEESGLRRELITMASLLQDGKIAAEAKVESGTNWLDVVRTNYKADDMLVCFAEQRTGLLRRPLRRILESNFKATVYIISDLTPQKSKPDRLLQISAWLGSMAIIIGFGVLQARVVQLPEGWLQSVLLILSIIPEFWLIWVWNSLFG